MNYKPLNIPVVQAFTCKCVAVVFVKFNAFYFAFLSTQDPDWEAHHDHQTGTTYYYNSKTGAMKDYSPYGVCVNTKVASVSVVSFRFEACRNNFVGFLSPRI